MADDAKETLVGSLSQRDLMEVVVSKGKKIMLRMHRYPDEDVEVLIDSSDVDALTHLLFAAQSKLEELNDTDR